jgi:hypothetical protein
MDILRDNLFGSIEDRIKDVNILSLKSGVITNNTYYDFTEVIENLGGRLSYMDCNKYALFFECAEYKYNVKIILHPKNGIDKAEIKITQLLSELVKKQYIPHLTLPICVFDTNIKPFLNLIENGNININSGNGYKYKKCMNMHKRNIYDDLVSVIIMEHSNNSTLHNYIEKNKLDNDTWRILLFQVLSTLVVIVTEYPLFRHNSFKPDNVLLNKYDIGGDSDKFKYEINDTTYIIPNNNYQTRIIGFNLACIPMTTINGRNQYSDIYQFFTCIIQLESIPKETFDFILRVIHENNPDIEYVTPDELIKNDPYFAKFRKNKKF